MINLPPYRCYKNISRGLKIVCFPVTLYISFSLVKSLTCNAHLIEIDHKEFHANEFLRPTLSHTLEELARHVPLKELTPFEYMVDLTNDLAFRILHYHSILNRNNFAFSPTALMSVLVALYEGSAGSSKTEIKNILRLPNNSNIIRVGYRDIHRRLRTYFFDTDNPLKGLSLNKENVTITRDYETILMFYGYDLGVDMVSSTAVPITTELATTHTIATTTSLNTFTKDIMTSTPKLKTPTISISQEMPNTTARKLYSSTEKQMSAAELNTSAIEENITTTKPEETTKITAEKMQEEKDTMEAPISYNNTTEAPNKSNIETNEAAELISSFVAEEKSEPFSRIQKARVTRLPSAKLQAPLTSKVKPVIKYLPAHKKSSRLQARGKRHLFGLQDFDSNLFINIFNAESQLHRPLATGSALAPLPTYVQISNDYELDTDPNFVPTQTQTPTNFKQNFNTDIISHVFYLNNKQIIYTTFKVYNAVLYYKYFEHLRVSVLELELDTSEYNLIILLPDYDTDIVSAAASLRAGPKLRLMRKQLKPKWVQAIIPDFKLHGTMFLTNDLQNLGICDLFEPNRANFRQMTDEKGIYVKHIEQSINVHIRTNPIHQLRQNNGAETQPIHISVNHPFMFFVIDRDLDIAVMSGRVLNPLNVRIQ